jgi:transposase
LRIVKLAEDGLTAQPIYDRLRLEEPDFRGSYYAVRAVWRRWRRTRSVRPEDVTIPVESAPGDVAQVDFGYVGRLYDAAAGCLRKAWVFLVVLAHSRLMFALIVFDKKIETWLRLHVEAFAAPGGVPRTLVPDNLKAAVIRAAFGVDGIATLNRSYRELARHFGFKIDPTPICSPEKKGKAESGVRYAKRDFFTGRSGEDVEVTRSALAWLGAIANARIHGTTHRVPREVFESEERAALLTLPLRPYELVWHKALVHRDCHAAFDRRLYSVPWRLVGERSGCGRRARWRSTPTSRVSRCTTDGAPLRAARWMSICRPSALPGDIGVGITGRNGPTATGPRSEPTFGRSSPPPTCFGCCALCRRSSLTWRSFPASGRRRVRARSALRQQDVRDHQEHLAARPRPPALPPAQPAPPSLPSPDFGDVACGIWRTTFRWCLPDCSCQK